MCGGSAVGAKKSGTPERASESKEPLEGLEAAELLDALGVHAPVFWFYSKGEKNPLFICFYQDSTQ